MTPNLASFDWEALLPVLFFVLYGLAQFIGSRKKPQADEVEDEPEVDPIERARQIREEIRRKIEERRRAMEAEQSGTPGAAPSTAQPRYNPNLPDGQPVRPAEPARPAPRPTPVPSQMSTLEAETSPMSRLEQQLEEQRKRLADARRQQEEAHQRAIQIQEAAMRRKSAQPRNRKKAVVVEAAKAVSFRDEVITGLRSPGGLRKAVLYREVLGPPVGMRR